MRLLVTGGAGFIGSNYARWVLSNTDDAVTVYDALTYAGNLSTLVDLEQSAPDRFCFVHADTRDVAALEVALNDHQAVVHFAAETHVDRSISRPQDFITTNCVGTDAVMRACQLAQLGRVVHVSSDQVYGSIDTGTSVETDPLDPRSPYSASKAASDLIARSYFSTYGLPVLITRSSNNFGPWQHPEKFIPLFATNLLDGKNVPLHGDGLNRRDWLHVDDNCAAIDAVLRGGQPGEIYNIGGPNELTTRELTDRLLALAGASPERIDYVPDRPSHERRYAINSSKILALGWKPTRQLDSALEATFVWYRDNRWWWEPLKKARPRS